MVAFSSIILVASIGYQYTQYKKAKKAAAAARDANAGINFSAKGESVPLRKYYGYNKAELYPVFFELRDTFTWPGASLAPAQTNGWQLPNEAINAGILNSWGVRSANGSTNGVHTSTPLADLANCGRASTASTYPGLDNPLANTNAIMTNSGIYLVHPGKQIVVKRSGMAWAPPAGKSYYSTSTEIINAIRDYWTVVDTLENYSNEVEKYNFRVQPSFGGATSYYDWFHEAGLSASVGGNRREFLTAQYVLLS